MLDLLHVAPTAFLIGMVKTLAVGVVGKLLRLPEVLKIPFDCTMGLRKNNEDVLENVLRGRVALHKTREDML